MSRGLDPTERLPAIGVEPGGTERNGKDGTKRNDRNRATVMCRPRLDLTQLDSATRGFCRSAS
ncbi:hypothetical protein BRD01_01585 [Halobacteriales archaeon QS_8_65_32]|nr:MAG: hypothetical protein BRD01_01585 [Halobacteriales archaeon QS_8_65_32]